MDAAFAPWFAGKSLSTDWTSRYFPFWSSLFAPRRDEAIAILEIGSWEGLSALFFANYFPNAQLTCIDTFEGSREHHTREHWAAALPLIEQRFDDNLEPFFDRVEKRKGRSAVELARLLGEGRRFDLAFIDGSHQAADVQIDALLAWPMVKEGGIVIFDDYDWNQFQGTPSHPKQGVDSFLSLRAGRYRELQRDYQLIVEKTETRSR